MIVDLDNTDSAPACRRERRRLGFYSHVDVETRRRAEEAGFDLVVPRSRMAREMPALVDGLLPAALTIARPVHARARALRSLPCPSTPRCETSRLARPSPVLLVLDDLLRTTGALGRAPARGTSASCAVCRGPDAERASRRAAARSPRYRYQLISARPRRPHRAARSRSVSASRPYGHHVCETAPNSTSNSPVRVPVKRHSLAIDSRVGLYSSAVTSAHVKWKPGSVRRDALVAPLDPLRSRPSAS